MSGLKQPETISFNEIKKITELKGEFYISLLKLFKKKNRNLFLNL